jgi:hypothetical protein
MRLASGRRDLRGLNGGLWPESYSMGASGHKQGI